MGGNRSKTREVNSQKVDRNSKKTWAAAGSMGVATFEAATGGERRRRC
jgi:hypothetical protein